MLKQAESAAQTEVPARVASAVKQMMTELAAEIQRMTALKRHNPGVRDEEIRLLQSQGKELERHLKQAGLRLDAVRLVVTL